MNLPVTLAELEAFLAVAELGSFSRAADQLCITQPAVTGRIARLEKTLGCTLIERSTREQTLTADGERVRLIAERALGEVRLLFEAGDQRNRRPRARVRVACTGGINALFLPPVIHAFNQQHPDTLIQVTDGSPTAVIEAVRTRRADLGIMAPGPASPDIVFTPLVEDECLVVARADHPLAAMDSVRFRDVLAHPILMADDQLPLRRTVQALADARGLDFNRANEGRFPGSILNMFSMVASGYGIMLQPKSLARLNVELPLRTIPIEDVRVPHVYGLIELAKDLPGPATRQFRQFLIEAADAGQS